MRVAGVDIGSNSIRLLVADTGAAGLLPVDRRMVITRLAEGVDATGRLAPTPAARTLETLREFGGVCRALGVTAICAAATSACRDAANREEFFADVEAAIGVCPQILSGTEEARLAFEGVASGLPPGEGDLLVVDIGGGSTEFAIGRRPGSGGAFAEMRSGVSLDIGCVRVTERYLRGDPPAAREIEAACQCIEAALDGVEAAFDPAPAGIVAGVAGTVTTLAMLHLGLAEYDPVAIHHSHLPRSAVLALFEKLASMTAAERRALPGVEAARAGVIVGGTAILAAVLCRWGMDEILVSEADILDGLAMRAAASPA